MKKILGYVIFYLIGLLCIISMMYRVESLDRNISIKDNVQKNNSVFY